MKTILLKFAGPLQSWGINSHFETRQTQRYPTKSAIVGMLAASLGYERHEDKKIQKLNSLEFAVRVDQPGSILRDYHTATKYKPNGQLDRTYVTNRYYLQDAVFVVAVGSRDDQFLLKIEEALKAPYFQPFLGRRSLPINADFFIGLKEGDIISNLEALEWQAASWYQRKNERKLEVYADSHFLSSHRKTMARDNVMSFSQKERKFGFRSISMAYVVVDGPMSKDAHDVFGSLGG